MPTAQTRSLPPKFDSRAPEVLADPYPVYERLRAAGPLCRGGPGQWVVTRHADVARLVRDRRLSHEYPPEYHEFSVGDGPANTFFQRILLDRDAPEHTRLRGLMASAFSPKLVKHLHHYIGEQVDRLLAPALERGAFDVVSDLSYPLPVQVVCELVGIPPVDRDLIRPWAADLAKAFALHVPDSERAAVHAAVAAFRGYIGELVESRRRRGGDDLISGLLAAHRADPTLSIDEIVDNVIFLFFAGFETTTNLISTSYGALLEHPDQLELLRADPALVPVAVEEFLRYDAPIQATARMVREPLELGGRTIRAGRVVVLLLGSANHDPSVFAEPGRLDVTREHNPHVSFGGGPHHCLGASLARVEGAAAVQWLLKNVTRIEAAGEIVRRPSATFRCYSTMPVTVR